MKAAPGTKARASASVIHINRFFNFNINNGPKFKGFTGLFPKSIDVFLSNGLQWVAFVAYYIPGPN